MKWIVDKKNDIATGKSDNIEYPVATFPVEDYILIHQEEKSKKIVGITILHLKEIKKILTKRR